VHLAVSSIRTRRERGKVRIILQDGPKENNNKQKEVRRRGEKEREKSAARGVREL